MALVEQVFLKPGRYGASGDWTKERIGAHIQGTRKLIEETGYKPPLLFEHAPPGSDDGAPKQFSDDWDKRAQAIRNGAGWLVDVKQNADGAGVYVLDVKNADAARGLKDGSIAFTSPEFRKSWLHKDSGKTYENLISHVALTHKPRAISQGKIKPVEVLQFSLADYEGPIQMSDDEKPDFGKKDDDSAGDGKSGDSKPKDSNPDMPKQDGPTDGDQQITAILAHLNTLGVGLPADTDSSNFNDRLLTALLTHEALSAKNEAEEPKEEEEQKGPITEGTPPMQFSLADATGDKLENKLLSKVIRQEHEKFAGRLEGMVKAGQITPYCRDSLLSHTAAQQFSAEGEHQIAFSLPQVVQILEQSSIPGWALSPEQFSGMAEAEHPKGKEFTHGTSEPTAAEAESLAAQVWGKKKT